MLCASACQLNSLTGRGAYPVDDGRIWIWRPEGLASQHGAAHCIFTASGDDPVSRISVKYVMCVIDVGQCNRNRRDRGMLGAPARRCAAWSLGVRAHCR